MNKYNLIPFVISLLFALVIGFLLSSVAKLGLPAAIGIGLIVFLVPLIYERPDLGLGLVAFFLPFERIPSFEIGGASVKINHVLIVVVGLIFLFKELAAKRLQIPKDPLRYLILLFVAVLTFSFPQAANLQRSLTVFLFVLLMFALYLIVTFMVRDKKTLQTVLYGLVAGAAFSAALGLFQFAGDAVGLPTQITLLKEGYDKSTFGFARVQATAQEPLYFANYIFIPMILLIVLLLRGQIEKLINKNFAYVLATALLLNLILAVSRGAYIGLAASILVLLITQAKLIFRAKTVLTTILIAAFVLVGAYLGLVKSEPKAIDEFVKHVMVNDREEGESVVSRVSATREAYEMFLDHPVFGVGLGNYGPLAQGDPTITPESGWFIVNNEYVELLAENGITGLSFFVLIIIVVLWRGIKAFQRTDDSYYKSILVGLMLAFFAILVQYATFSTIYIFHIWFLIALLSAVSAISIRENAAR